MPALRKTMLLFVIGLFVTNIATAQFGGSSKYYIQEFYSKVDLPYGAIDQSGIQVDAVYVPTDLSSGTYEIIISDSTGDLFEIEGTDTYIRFSSYFGYAYRQKCLLQVESGYSSSYVYKIED